MQAEDGVECEIVSDENRFSLFAGGTRRKSAIDLTNSISMQCLDFFCAEREGIV